MGGIGIAVRAVVGFLRVDPLSQHGRMPSVTGGVIEVDAQDIHLDEIDRDRVTSCAIVSDRNRR